jgi:hypothetical protein
MKMFKKFVNIDHFTFMSVCAHFAVNNVPVSEIRLKAMTDVDFRQELSSYGIPLAYSIKSTDSPVVELFNKPNLLAVAVYRAFYDHYPLKFNPNVVWLVILQGLTQYFHLYPDELREKCVTHKGQRNIQIIRPDFFQNIANDWPSVFPQFSKEIEQTILPGTRELFECNFSNTTPTDVACSHITLMSSFKEYFSYGIRGGCGIPWIELLGTVADWRLLKRKAEGLRRFQVDGKSHLGLCHFKQWLDNLIPLLEQFVSAAEGHPDIVFWGSVCNMDSGSGTQENP